MSRSPYPLTALGATALAVLLSTAASARVVTDTIALDGAPPAKVSVYLPAGYDAETTRVFPLLVLLHGLGGAEEDWRTYGAIEATLNTAIAKGTIRPVVAVIPDGHNGYWTDWPDGAPAHRFGALVDPITTTWAASRFRVSKARVIIGVSMGGFGALSIALRHPERWTAAVSLSGALFTRPPLSKPVYLAAFGTPGLRQHAFPLVNPLSLIQLGQADKLPIWLDCGADDLPKFTEGLKAASAALTRRGVAHAHRFRPGKHDWGVWRLGFAEALPWIERELARVETP